MTWRLKLRLITFAILVLVPFFLHFHGTWIYFRIFPAPSWFSLASHSPHRAPGRCCVERMQELHNNSLHGAGQRSISICSPSQHHFALMKPWSQSYKKGARHNAKMSQEQSTDTTVLPNSSSLTKKIGCKNLRRQTLCSLHLVS